MKYAKSRRGAALLFIILAILGLGLIGGTVAINVRAQKDEQAITFTKTKIKRIAMGISSSVFDNSGQVPRHYESDVGALPASLNDLVTSGAACTLSAATGLLTNWCGPYWLETFVGEDINTDGWGRTLIYTAGSRRIHSMGVNGVNDAGGSDDIIQTF